MGAREKMICKFSFRIFCFFGRHLQNIVYMHGNTNSVKLVVIMPVVYIQFMHGITSNFGFTLLNESANGKNK